MQDAEPYATSSNAMMSKRKDFFGFFIVFLEGAWNLKHFETEDEYPSLIISKIIDSERGSYLNV